MPKSRVWGLLVSRSFKGLGGVIQKYIGFRVLIRMENQMGKTTDNSMESVVIGACGGYYGPRVLV